MPSERILYKHNGMTFFQRDPDTYVLRHGPYWLTAIIFGVTMFPGFAFMTYITLLGMILHRNLAEFLFVAVLFAFTLTMSMLILFISLKSSFSRQFIFHTDSLTCTYCNIPGLRLKFDFEQIDFIELIGPLGPYDGMICIARKNSRRPLALCALKNLDGTSDEITSVLTPLAQYMSTITKRPFRHRDPSMFFLYTISWW